MNSVFDWPDLDCPRVEVPEQSNLCRNMITPFWFSQGVGWEGRAGGGGGGGGGLWGWTGGKCDMINYTAQKTIVDLIGGKVNKTA